jgi:S1-C subfamily serine protease
MLRAGDVILRVNGRDVRADDDAYRELEVPGERRVELLRKGKRMTVTMR